MSRNEEITEKQQENKFRVRFVDCVTVELENFSALGDWVGQKLRETFSEDKSTVCKVWKTLWSFSYLRIETLDNENSLQAVF